MLMETLAQATMILIQTVVETSITKVLLLLTPVAHAVVETMDHKKTLVMTICGIG